ncbi:MAG TPA: hypothetical protein VGD64_12475 [Acidisarcina sp.]
MFHWDSSNIIHVGKHGVSPEEVEQVFTNAPFDIERQFRGGEERTVHMGETAAGRVLIVIVTIGGNRSEWSQHFRRTERCGSSIQSKRSQDMPKTLETPEFKTEVEEARWWADNQALLLKEFEEAAKDGTLGRSTLVKRGQTPTITIRLDPADIELARRQAEQRGLRYQTYLKMVIHQALQQEAGK